MYDVIVVGARCAGSPLSMLLARKGYRVLLLDKAHFPSDTVSTHVIWQAGLARAKKWGLLEGIAGLGAPVIRNMRFETGGIGFEGCPPPADGIDYAVAPRRVLLDKLLVDAASAAGAEVREGFYASGIVADDVRVTGIRGRAANGSETTEKARLVVGADGRHSLVAKSINAPKYNVRPSTASGYYSYWHGGPPATAFETLVEPGWGGAVIPTNDGLTCIVAAWTSAFHGHPAEGYRRFMESHTQTAAYLNEAERAEPLRGMPEMQAYFRQSHGAGWALAGDAAYHKHPLSAQGITDAFRDADWLAEAIDEGLSGRRELAEALAECQGRREAAVMAMYESTCERARLEPFTPEALALFRALRHNRAEAGRFFGTDAGTVPLAEFFAPENLARIVRSAPSEARPPS